VYSRSALRTVESAASVAGIRLDCVNVEDVCVVGSKNPAGARRWSNLLDNAIKFNRPSGEVRIEAKRVQNGLVSITVTDTGHRHRIGRPSTDFLSGFYRVDKGALARAVGGTGLGLSIVKHVVERMNGKNHGLPVNWGKRDRIQP